MSELGLESFRGHSISPHEHKKWQLLGRTHSPAHACLIINTSNFSFQTLSVNRMCEKLFSGVRYWALEIKTNFLLSHTSFRGLQTTWCTIFRDCLRNFVPFCRNSFINLSQSLARSFFRGLLSALPARQELGCLTSFTRKNTCIENTSHSEQSRWVSEEKIIGARDEQHTSGRDDVYCDKHLRENLPTLRCCV